MTLAFRQWQGADIAAVIDQVAALRIAVFRDWPYLYDGDLDYERDYLRSYTQTRAALVITAHAGDTVVGAATGMPLAAHADDFAAALARHDIAQDDIFYCAESVLLPPYRGQGAGQQFFAARESLARRLGLRWSMFCAVQRPADHPARPAGYRPLDDFWQRRGYAPVPGALARFSWRDVGHTQSTEKALQVWLKDLSL